MGKEQNTDEKISIMDAVAVSPLAEMLKLNLSDCMALFKVYRTTYYNNKNSAQKEGGRKYELNKEDMEIKLRFIEIVKKIGYVPGSRTFHTFMIRDYGIHVSVDRCRRLMKEMNLFPINGRPPVKKAKKKAGTHCHPCAAVENLVCQDFYQGARNVILTDITYLYTNEYQKVIYLCVFYDCFTKEALGWSVCQNMTTAIVQEAYDRMMESHGDELRGTKVLIHSDQGSQYTSTTFKQLLSDEGILQSMSERGNSQDNAPMESFFGRMKERILNLIASCQDFETAQKLINGYMNRYNNEDYQFNLAGLTPAEFYQYTQNGIYPLDEYYGVKSDELGTQKKLIDSRIAAARKRNAQEREAYRKRREREQRILSETPDTVVLHDQKLLEKRLHAQEFIRERAEDKISAINKIMEKTNAALDFIRGATKEILDELKNPLKWKNYSELSYVFDMNGMY